MNGKNNSKVGKVVYHEGTPNFSKVSVYLNPAGEVRPGELLKIVVGEKRWLIGRVLDANEINPYEQPEHANIRELLGLESISGREDLPRKFRIATLDILEEAENKDSGLILHEPRTLAKVGSEVYRVSGELFMTTLNILEEKDRGLFIGYALGGYSLPIVLDPETVLPRHILIVGGTGTGKSYFRGVLLEEIKKLGIPQINIDIHGEYNKATKELGGVILIPGDSLTVPLSSLAEPEILGLMPQLTDLQSDIFRMAYVSLRRRSREFGIDDLLREVENAGERMAGTRRTTDLVSARVEALREVRIIGEGIDWKDILSKYPVVNIDCRKLSYTELQAVAGAVGRDITRLRNPENPQIPPVILSIDEAHMFIPNSGGSSSSFIIRETIRMGRHKGIGIILMTQNPNDIDRSSIKLTNTRFIFSIEQDQLDSLKGVFSDTPRDIINRLPKFEVGTCLITGSRESIRHSIIAKIRERKTTHGGETPKMVTKEEK